jgi:hypothetical protein
MPPVVSALLALAAGLFRSSAIMHLKKLALRHQLAVYKHTVVWSPDGDTWLTGNNPSMAPGTLRRFSVLVGSWPVRHGRPYGV